MLSATELHERGLVASNASRYVRARGLFRTALERSVPGEDTARILLSLAHVESELGGRAEGLSLCDEALATPGLSAPLIGLIQSQRGMLLGRSGMIDESLAAFADAAHLLGDDPAPQFRVHLNRGNVYLMRNDVVRASRDFERAVEIADEAELPVQKAKAESNLGYARLLSGDLVSALQMMDAARPTLAALSPTTAAVCEQDRAEVLVASGLASEADHALRTAASAFGARGLRHQQAEAELVRARLLLLDNPHEAATVARRASRRFAGRGSEGWSLRAEAVSLAAAMRSAPKRPRVVERATEAIGELRTQGLPSEASVLALHVAGALVDGGDAMGAADQVHNAHVTDRSPLVSRLLAREVRARVAQSRGRRTDAMQHLRRGLADLHGWQSSFGSLDLQSSVVIHGRGLALQGLDLAMEDGRPDVVFEWAERARALASRVSPLRPPHDADAASDLAELRQLQSELNEAEARGAVPKALIAHANRLRNRIRQRAWYGEGSGLVTEPAALDEASAELDLVGGVLLSHLVVDDKLYCLVVGGGGAPDVVELGAYSDVEAFLNGMQADLDMAAARMEAVMAAAIRGSLDYRLARLAELLVAPLSSRVGDRRVVLVPSGSLAGVPWSLLPGLSGRPLTVPRSATTWLGDHSADFTLRSAGFVAGPGVDRAPEEVTRASVSWDSAVSLVGDQAGSRAVHDLASEVDVFHVAAHGRHSAENPLFSGLELADGPWFGYDIDQLDAIPSTVVLSSCELGRSSVRWGEETIGMTVAWLHAGARCVIASPALVNDDTACEVLAATHARLAAGADPSDALAAATDEVDHGAPAPFICFGSGW